MLKLLGKTLGHTLGLGAITITGLIAALCNISDSGIEMPNWYWIILIAYSSSYVLLALSHTVNSLLEGHQKRKAFKQTIVNGEYKYEASEKANKKIDKVYVKYNKRQIKDDYLLSCIKDEEVNSDQVVEPIIEEIKPTIEEVEQVVESTEEEKGE